MKAPNKLKTPSIYFNTRLGGPRGKWTGWHVKKNAKPSPVRTYTAAEIAAINGAINATC